MGRCLSVRPVETVVIRHAPCCASLLLLLVSGCGQQSPAPVAPAPQQTPVAAHSAASEPPPLFAGLIPAVPSPLQWEMVKDSGLDFTYYGNPSPQHYMTEQNGGGVAVFDYDRDGRVRTAYSLRHTYICLRLIEGADIYQIAKNCRTSVEMIEQFYASHIKNTLDASAINVRKPKKKPKKTKD